MKKIITYFMVVGYVESEGEATEQYQVQEWECNSEEEFEFALECIDESLILGIK